MGRARPAPCAAVARAWQDGRMSEKTATFPIRTATPESVRAFLAPPMTAFGEELTDAEFEEWNHLLEPDRLIAAFDGETADRDGRRVHVPDDGPRRGGRRRPASPWWAWSPATAGSGVLRSLMRHQLDDVHGRGEPLAILWASESVIYQRFGYGLGIEERLVRDRPRANGLAPAVGARGRAAAGRRDGGAGDVPADLRADAGRHAGRAEPDRDLVALGDPARRRAHAARRRTQVPLPLRGRRRGRGLRDLPAEERLGRSRARRARSSSSRRWRSPRAPSAPSGASCSASTSCAPRRPAASPSRTRSSSRWPTRGRWASPSATGSGCASWTSRPPSRRAATAPPIRSCSR